MYKFEYEFFVLFDIMCGKEWDQYWLFKNRVQVVGFYVLNVVSYGLLIFIEKVMDYFNEFGSGYGVIDLVEGLIYCIECKGEVDFFIKYVCFDKVDGKYFLENNNGIIIWNI